MTNILKTIVSPEGTIKITINEGDTSADVMAKMESALANHPLTVKLGRTSIKDIMYGRKTSVSGWSVKAPEVAAPAVPVEPVAVAPEVAAPAVPVATPTVLTVPADSVIMITPATAADAVPAVPEVAAPAVASPEAAAVKHTKARKPRVAKVKGGTPVVRKGRQEKIYKVGPVPAVGTGLMAKITAAVAAGHNTQTKLLAFFPDAKKSTVQHEMCGAGPTNRQFIVIDEAAMAKAATE